MTIYYPIAAGDIESSRVFARKFRGKMAKEVYRCGKGILFTRSIVKPIGYAVSTIPTELSKGFVYSVISNVGQEIIGYVSGVGFIRYLYKALDPGIIKGTARVIYNVGCLPMTLYSKGIGSAFDGIGLSKVETWWFGQPVYIFDDNRLWVEKNFTIRDAFQAAEDSL